MKELWGKTGVWVGLVLPSVGGGTKAGVQSPQWGNCLSQEKKHLRLGVKQLICGRLNGMRIRQSLLQPCIPWTVGTQVPWKAQQPGAGIQGLWSNPRARAAVDCRETDVREETVVGNACGGKPGSHGSKVILLSHTWGWSHHHSPLPQASTSSWTIQRLIHQTPAALNYRVGPHSGFPFKGLMHRSTEQDPSQGGLSMCLKHQTIEMNPSQGSPLSTWAGRATEKDWPKRPSDYQL